MSTSFPGDLFGGIPRGAGSSGPVGGIWEAMDQLRGLFDQKVTAPRMGRGDVRVAILALLSEQPMHGYQVINEIGERSGGSWKPSPGSVYPTLQLLTDEGLLRAEESNGRKTYALTDAGVAAAEAAGPAPWESPAPKSAPRTSALPKAGMELAQAVAQVGRSGSGEQIDEAVALLEETRRKVYSILARD